MPIFKLRKNKPRYFEQIIASNEILPAHSRQQGLAFLVALFSEIRPGPGKTRVRRNQVDSSNAAGQTNSSTSHTTISPMVYKPVPLLSLMAE
jgi:hypothetical protein